MIQKGILILMLLMTDPGDIGKINATKSEAKKAYLAGDYKTAIEKYTFLVDSIGVKEDEVMMNLANSYFQLNDTSNAMSAFQPLTMSSNPKLKSVANQQLGVLSNRKGNFEEALTYFKQALKANPANDDARYNYEMVKKKLEEQKKKEQQKQDKNKDKKEQQDQEKKEDKEQEQKDKEQEQKDQQKKDQENKDQKDQEKKEQDEKEKKEKEQKEKDKEQQEKEKQDQEKKDIPPSVKEKLKDMDMSEEKAKMILEAMKNQEIQYLQQNKRKATKQRDKTKPDW
ncbi:MAG: tetratricopeptide repeat protein [Bacteroidota bacterium]